MDPAAVAKRKGGRKPIDPSYILRGTVFCLRCGAALYTREQAVGRVYVCSHRRQSTGICDAPAIPADLIEGHVLEHLDVFVGAVEQWLAGQDAEHAAEGRRRRKQADRQREDLHTLDGRRERLMDDYERLLADDDPAARLVLGRASKLDEERAALVQAIESAESVAAEWTTDVAPTVSYYEDVADALRERLRRAEGAQAMNATLRSVLAALWAEVEEDRERLLVEFELREPTEYLLAGTKPIFARRPTLPPRHTGTFTLVCVRPAVRARISL